MPVKSAAQFRLMEGAAHGGGYGPSPDVAKEMLAKTGHAKRSLFAKGNKGNLKNLKNKKKK